MSKRGVFISFNDPNDMDLLDKIGTRLNAVICTLEYNSKYPQEQLSTPQDLLEELIEARECLTKLVEGE